MSVYETGVDPGVGVLWGLKPPSLHCWTLPGNNIMLKIIMNFGLGMIANNTKIPINPFNSHLSKALLLDLYLR